MILISAASWHLIQNNLAVLEPQYKRQKQLYERKLLSKQDFEKTEADYNYNLGSLEVYL